MFPWQLLLSTTIACLRRTNRHNQLIRYVKVIDVATHTPQRKPISRTATPERRSIRRLPRRSRAPTARAVDLGGLTEHLGYLARRLQLWIFQDFIRTLAVVEIGPAQYSVLSVVKANPGLSQMAVAQALGIERARVVHLIDRLEARRLVKRQSSRNDRRSHALHLTADGQRALVRIKDLAAQHEKHVAARLGAANHKALIRLLSSFARP
jgi:DNA-binding MarR family transcriptional regulator